VGLTLVAILTAALLLPGIIAARAYYFAGETREVEVPVPPLSTADGIALVGAFSAAVHFIYVIVLKAVLLLPPIIPLPLANPYLFFAEPRALPALDAAWALFSGLALLSLLAAATGFLAGRATLRWGDKSRFYGPLADVIHSANGDDKFLTAYVITKLEEGKRLVGYQGTVDSLFRDADRFPTKVVLKEVAPFYLDLSEDSLDRRETDQVIDWLVLTADDWHNIAFRAFQLVEENESSVPAAQATASERGMRQ
jgi:hypothetical protein